MNKRNQHPQTSHRTEMVMELRRRYLEGTLNEALEITEAGIDRLIDDMMGDKRIRSAA